MESMDAYYERMIQKRFGDSKEEIIAKLSPSFNINDLDHEHTTAKLGKYMIKGIDVDLAPLLERINMFGAEPLTTMSCQHNLLGWASCCFSYEGFQKFITILRAQYIKKYGHVNDRPLKGLYGRLLEPNSTRSKKSVIIGEYRNISDDATIEVGWDFDPKEIPKIIAEFDTLFDDLQITKYDK